MLMQGQEEINKEEMDYLGGGGGEEEEEGEEEGEGEGKRVGECAYLGVCKTR